MTSLLKANSKRKSLAGIYNFGAHKVEVHISPGEVSSDTESLVLRFVVTTYSRQSEQVEKPDRLVILQIMTPLLLYHLNRQAPLAKPAALHNFIFSSPCADSNLIFLYAELLSSFSYASLLPVLNGANPSHAFQLLNSQRGYNGTSSRGSVPVKFIQDNNPNYNR